MSEVGFEIVNTKEAEKNGVKYLNINISNSEVERNPDIVRLCADAGILEYAKPKIGHWIPIYPFTDPRDDQECSECGQIYPGATRYCPDCGTKMFESQESEV